MLCVALTWGVCVYMEETVSNKSKQADPRIFVVAANDEMRDSQAQWNVVWEVRITPAFSRHVLGVRVTVYDNARGTQETAVVKYENHWPNSTASTWEAFLYQCYHRTARMVENWAIMDGGRAQTF